MPGRPPSQRAPSQRAPSQRAPSQRPPSQRALSQRALSQRALSQRALFRSALPLIGSLWVGSTAVMAYGGIRFAANVPVSVNRGPAPDTWLDLASILRGFASAW
jgi:hypothetical protein